MLKTYTSGVTRLLDPSAEVAKELCLPVRGRLSTRMMIGRREWLSLPEFDVDIMSAKVDTGAYTSSLHAENREVFLRDGVEWVSFITHNHHGKAIECESRLIQRKKIKSSTGKGCERLIVKTTAMAVGGFQWDVLFSLADRSIMKCPMLIGRRALSGYFVVDTQASHLFGNLKNLKGELHHRRL